MCAVTRDLFSAKETYELSPCHTAICIYIYIYTYIHICIHVCVRAPVPTHTHRLWPIGGNSAPGAIFRTSPLRAGKEHAHTGILGPCRSALCVCERESGRERVCECVKYTIVSDAFNIPWAKKFQVS